MVKRNSQFWTEFGWKTGKWSKDRWKRLSNSIMVCQKGRRLPNMSVIFLWNVMPAQPNDFYLSPAYTCAQQKLSGNIKSTLNLIYELTWMTQVCLNITNAAFLYTDLEISTYLSVCKLNTFGRKFEIGQHFGWNSLFWTDGKWHFEQHVCSVLSHDQLVLLISKQLNY